MFDAQEKPLQHHGLVDTRAVDEARDAIGRIFCPHFLDVRDRSAEGFHAVHNAVEQPGYSVNFVAYGAEVEIDPGELSDFFLLQLPFMARHMSAAAMRPSMSPQASAPRSFRRRSPRAWSGSRIAKS